MNRVCVCKGCDKEATPHGLCEHHYENALSARKEGTFRLWCYSHHVYKSNVNKVFKNAGNIITDVCKCGTTYERLQRGSRRMCPECLMERQKNRWTKQNTKRHNKKRITAFLANRGDNDPNIKPWIHRGPPRQVTWYCEFSGCSEPYEITLHENKNRYNRFCEKHRGII